MAKEISIIRQEAQQVQNATQVGENTAQRVGGVLTDLVDKAEEHETDIDNIKANTGVADYPTFSESTAYSAGDVVNYMGKLYQFTSDHAAGAWMRADALPYSLVTHISQQVTKQNVLPLYSLSNPLKNDNTLGPTYNTTWRTYFKIPAKKGDVFTYIRKYKGFLDSDYSYYIVTKTDGTELTRLDSTGSSVDINLNYEMPEDGFVSVCFNPTVDVVSLMTKELGLYDEIDEIDERIDDKINANYEQQVTKQNVLPLYSLSNPLKNDNTLGPTYNTTWRTYFKIPAKKGDVFTYIRKYKGFLDSDYSYYIVTKTDGTELTRLDSTGSSVDINLNYEMPEDGFVSVCFNPTVDVVSLMTKELGLYDEIGTSIEDIEDSSIIYSPFLGIYKFGVIGDSLSVGHMTNPINSEVNSRNLKFSWGQMLARKIGQICLDFGFSGATATTWFTNTTYKCSEELSKPENLCQVYIIGLGANADEGGLGSFSDIDWDNQDNNAQTFYGQYARIIQLIRKVAPQAVIFCLTLPYPREDKSKNNAIKQICADGHVSSNTFVVDLMQYNNILQKYIVGDNEGEAPKTYNKYYYEWHFTAAGYAMCAELTQKAISKVMNDNANNNVILSIGQIPSGNNIIE